MEQVYSLNNIQEAARFIWDQSAKANVLAFHGSLGIGKTTLIHALCDVKKVTDVVGSPTFSIINEYSFTENGTEKKIYHIDLYRLKDEQEAIRAGVEDCFKSDHICLIEWPEKIPYLMPDNTLHIYMERIDETTRKLIIRDK